MTIRRAIGTVLALLLVAAGLWMFVGGQAHVVGKSALIGPALIAVGAMWAAADLLGL